MLSGWLEFTLMYNGLLSGLLYGSYLPVDRFRAKSRKLKTLRFVSLMVFMVEWCKLHSEHKQLHVLVLYNSYYYCYYYYYYYHYYYFYTFRIS